MNIARWHLGYPWCVSQVVETTLNILFERYGTNLGRALGAASCARPYGLPRTSRRAEAALNETVVPVK